MQAIKPLIISPTILGASREIQCFLQIRTFGDGQVKSDTRTIEQKRKDALDLARKALKNRMCADYIASKAYPNPLELLNTLDKKGQFIEQDLAKNWQYDSTGYDPAYTTGIGPDAKVNLLTGINEGPPTNRYRASFFERRRFGYQFATPGLDSTGHWALVVLHELSHATGKFKHFGDIGKHETPIDNQTLTKNIYQKCFGIWQVVGSSLRF